MALRWIDSFDHYATAQLGLKYTAAGGAIASGGRNSTNGLQSSTGALGLTLDAQETWIVGFAFKWGNNAATTLFVKFLDGLAITHVGVQINSAGNLQVLRGTTVLGTGSTVIQVGVWYYFEFKCNISDSVGAPVFRVNGVEETFTWVTGTDSTQDTRNAGNATANIIQLSGPGGGAVSMVDDYYICDTTGAAPTNDFLGDCRVEAIFPGGNGNSSQLVGNDGNSTDNYLLVDETSPSTTDYVESSTPGDKDTYAFGDLTSTSGTVYGVSVVPYATKTDAGSRSIVSVARLSATEVDSAVATLGASYVYYPEIRETKPGGGAWSISDVNSAEFGVKINA